MKLHLAFILLLFVSCGHPKSDSRNFTPIQASDKTLAFVYTENGKSGLTDSNKNVILPAQFDYIEHWQVDNLIRIDSGGKRISGGDVVGHEFKKYGLINIQGEILFRPQFDYLVVSNRSALVKKDGLYGFVDDKGDWLIKPKYKIADPFYEEATIVEDSGQFLILNKKGQKIMPQTFDTASSFKNGVALVEKDGKIGFVNFRGKYILPLQNYSGIGEYNWNFGEFQKDGKWFLIDTAGHIPIKEGFDEVQVRGDKDSVFAIGTQNGKPVKVRLR